MKSFILITAFSAIMASCAFVSPVPPPATTEVITAVMWCDTDKAYTEWEVRDNYFLCTASGTVWRFAE